MENGDRLGAMELMILQDLHDGSQPLGAHEANLKRLIELRFIEMLGDRWQLTDEGRIAWAKSKGMHAGNSSAS